MARRQVQIPYVDTGPTVCITVYTLELALRDKCG